ncbi:hypothetical protein CRUP_015238 [Coryphaenoides rupestris]|nr:hypothetical protein CRUP_015238 [Coryphaenoides rupestris]
MITSGSPPYPELEPQSVLPQLERSYRMERPEGCGAPLYNLMEYCWMWSFKDRPTYSAIIQLLESSAHLAATEALAPRGRVEPAQYDTIAGIHRHLVEVSAANPTKEQSNSSTLSWGYKVWLTMKRIRATAVVLSTAVLPPDSREALAKMAEE